MEAFCKLGHGSLPSCPYGHDSKAAKSAGNAPRYQEERLCESSHGTEATGNGIKGFCQVGYGASKDAGGVEEELHRALQCSWYGYGEDEATQDWVSPRISFSQDFVMEDMNAHVLPDSKKGEREKDNYSAEFDFLKNGTGYGVLDQAKSFMLPADELFFDGKLLPLPFSSILHANDDTSLPLPYGERHDEGAFSALKSNIRPIARHCSFDSPTPSSSSSSSSSLLLSSRATLLSCSCPASPSRSSLVHQVPSLSVSTLPPCSSRASRTLPASPRPPVASSSTSSALLPSLLCSISSSLSPSSSSLLSSSSTSASSLSSPSSVSKCSSKLKDLFRSKRPSISSSPVSEDNSIPSVHRPVVNTRSFWPFSRSKSAGDSKTRAPPPLPCRSNSAGETLSSTTLSVSTECGDNEGLRLSNCSSVAHSETQGPMAMLCQDNVHSTEARTTLDVARAEENRECFSLDQSAKSITGRADRMPVNGSLATVKSSSKASGKKTGGASVNVPKSSPGRRKGASDGSGGAKANGGKIVLRNLERRSAEKKVGGRDGCKGVSRRGAYPVGARVSPVLNVAVYRGGNTSKMGLFGFGTSKKEKKSSEAALNWRNGA